MGITSGVGIDVTIYYYRYKIASISWLCSGGEGHTILGSEVGAVLPDPFTTQNRATLSVLHTGLLKVIFYR